MQGALKNSGVPAAKVQKAWIGNFVGSLFSQQAHLGAALVGADEALRFASDELDLGQVLADQVVAAVDEPVLAAVLLGKSAQAQERGIDFAVDADSRVNDLAIEPSAVVTMVGNLVDNAIRYSPESDARSWASMTELFGETLR